jgi:hypothetical protein
MKSYFREAFDLSLARKMKRRDVIPASRQRHLLAQGQLMGVKNTLHSANERVSEAYDVGHKAGFNQASIQAHAFLEVIMLAVLRDEFGFGKQRAEKFAKAFEKLTIEVNAGRVAIAEIAETLIDEKFDFILEMQVGDNDGHIHSIDWQRMIDDEKSKRENDA